MSTRGRPALKRTLKIIAGVVLSLAVLLVLALWIVGDRLLHDYLRRQLVDLEGELQRPVRVENIDVSALRGRVQLRNLTIGPAENEPADKPPLELGSAIVDVGMWRTLLSLGFRPYVEFVGLEDAQLNVLKLPDGSYNWEHIAPDQAEAEQEADREAADEPDRRVRNAVVGEVQLKNINVLLAQQQPKPAQARISQMNCTLRDVGYRTHTKVDLAAAVVALQPNLVLKARLSPNDNAKKVPELEALETRFDSVDLAKLAPFYATDPASLVPTQGTASAEVNVARKKRDTHAKGTLSLIGAAFGRGKTFDARAAFDLLYDLAAGHIDLREAELRAGSMELRAKALLRDLDAEPRVERFAISSRELNFDSIRAMYPALDKLTAPARLSGPFEIRGSGGGDQKQQKAELEVQLASASVTIPDLLDKPKGTPLWIKAHLETGGNALSVAPLTLQLADYRLVVRGRAEHLDRDAPHFDFRVETPEPKVGSLLRLLPPVARAVPAQRPLAGELTVLGHAKGTTERFDAHGRLRMSGLQVDVPKARLQGGGEAQLELHVRGKDERSGSLRADFTSLTAQYADVVQKPGGTPARVDLRFEQNRKGGEANFSTALASLAMTGDATLKGAPPHQKFSARVDVPSFAVRRLLRLVPGYDVSTLGDIHFAGKLSASGTTGKPETYEAQVPTFTAKAGRSEVRGSLSLKNTVAPRVNLKARAPYLNLADFVPRMGEGGEQEETAKKETEDGMLARTEGTVDIEVDKGRAADVDFSNLRALLKLDDGRARAERLEVDAFGGRFVGTGTEFPLAPGHGNYELKGSIAHMQVAQMLQGLTAVPPVVTGSVSAKVDVTTRDLTPDALTESLTGRVEGNLQEGAFLPADGYAALTKQLGSAARVPALKQLLGDAPGKLGAKEGNAWGLREASAALRFKDGAAVLEKPLRAKTPQGQLSLEGKLGLKGQSDLRGDYALSPEALRALTGGRVDFKQPIAVPLRVQGPLTSPSLNFGELDRVVTPLLRGFAGEQGQEQLQRGAEQLMKQLGGKPSGDANKSDHKDKKPEDKRKQIKKGLRDLF